MTDPTLMDVLDTRDELQIELTGLLLAESGVPDDVVEELSSVAVLHDHVELLLSLNNLNHSLRLASPSLRLASSHGSGMKALRK